MLSSFGRIYPFPTYLFIIAFILQRNCRDAYCNYEELLQLIRLHNPACIVSRNIPLVFLFSRLLGIIPLSHLGFMAHIGGTVRAFCSTPRCPSRRFPSVSCYMLWLFVFIFDRIYTVCSGVPIARPDLVELLRQLLGPFLLVGDFNIRHPSWMIQSAPRT